MPLEHRELTLEAFQAGGAADGPTSWYLWWLREWLMFIPHQLASLWEIMDPLSRCDDELAKFILHGLLLDLKVCEFSFILSKVHSRVHFLLDIFHYLLKSRPM